MFMSRSVRKIMLALTLIAAGVTAATTTYAQGFMVKPMVLEAAPRPGQRVLAALELSNMRNMPAKLSLRPIMLLQDTGGAWREVDPESEAVAIVEPRSAMDWISVGSETVQLGPLEKREVEVEIRVPPAVRGFYSAGISVESVPDEGAGFNVLLQFLVAVRMHISGPPAREQVELTELAMQHRPAAGEKPGTTLVGAQIKNTGETLSKVGGRVVVMKDRDGQWMRVAEVPLPERGIMPGATLEPAVDLERRLPSGSYRLSGELTIGGRVRGKLTKDLEFEGDPEAGDLAFDVQLTAPELVEIEATPGSTRSSSIQVGADGSQALRVTSTILPPISLTGVAMGELEGESLICADWLEVMPPVATVRGGAMSNLRIVAKVPAEAIYPSYYALIEMEAALLDEQKVGDHEILVHLRNPRVEAVQSAEVLDVTLAQEGPSTYAVNAGFVNVGSTHFAPEAKAVLLSMTNEEVTSIALTGPEGFVLPLQSASFSGAIDFSGIADGTYRLTAAMAYAPGKAAGRTLVLKVATGDEGKSVSVVEVAATEGDEDGTDDATE
jgi:hypothetical protein